MSKHPKEYNLTRRQVLRSASSAIGTTTLFLSSCNSSPTKRDLSVLYFQGLAEGERLNRKGPDFTAKTGISVNFIQEKYDDIRRRQRDSFEKKEADYDVVFVDDIWMYEYASKRYIYDLTDLIKRDSYDYDDFFPKVIAAEGVLGDRRWLIPQRADVQVLFYNKKIFADPGVGREFSRRTGNALKVPDTWDEYLQVVRGLSGIKWNDTKVIGSAETLKAPHFAFEFFATRYWSITGEDFLDGSGAPLFNEPRGIAALDYMKSLKPYWAPNSLQAAHEESVNAFTGGNVALMPQWYAFYAVLKKTSIGDALGVALMPGHRDGTVIRRFPSIGGGSLGISRNSRRIEDAWKYIQYMTSAEIMAEAALDGEIITRQSAYKNPLVAKRNPASSVYVDSLDKSHFRPRTTIYADIEKAIGDAVSRALSDDQMTAGRALAAAAQYVIDAQRHSK